jgi:hypothetical protein
MALPLQSALGRKDDLAAATTMLDQDETGKFKKAGDPP